MRDSNPGGGLHVIFAIFLGLMVTAFVGVGVYTFLPPPWDAGQQRLGSKRSADALTADERQALEAVRAERYRIEDELTRPVRLPVIGSGLLLSGVQDDPG